jgi:hypothetical protein
MADEDQPPYQRLRNAFATNEGDRKQNTFPLGPLRAFASLFPVQFTTTSLATVASLNLSSRSATLSATDIPGLQVLLCVGRRREKSLFAFFDSILEFQTHADFVKLMSKGHSIIVLGGSHKEIVAAVSFVIMDEGIFIDAIAVANGHAPGACRLTNTGFYISNSEQEAIVNRRSITEVFNIWAWGCFWLHLWKSVL